MFLFYVHCARMFSHVCLFATAWTTAHQAPLSIGFSRQEYWSGVPIPPLGNLPNPGIGTASFMFPALAGGFFTTSATWEALLFLNSYLYIWASLVAQMVRNLPAMQETRFSPWIRKIP